MGPKYGRMIIDFKTLTVKGADAIMEKYQDFPYLQRKQAIESKEIPKT